VGVPGGDDALHGQEPGVAVVGMQPVALPGIVAEHHVGPGLPDDPAHLGPLLQAAAELAVDTVQEEHGPRPERRRGRPLLFLAERHERGPVGRRVPRTLGTVGQDELGDLAAGRGPLGQRGATAEVDVVGVGADRQSPLRDGQIDGDRTAAFRGQI